MRDRPACATIALSCPLFSGKNVLSTLAPDADRQLWPDGYEGWLGFPTAATTLIAGSALHGRMSHDVSFSSQQPIWESNIVALVNAYMCVVSSSDNPCAATQPESVGTDSQKPDVVGVPLASAQKVAIRTCSMRTGSVLGRSENALI